MKKEWGPIKNIIRNRIFTVTCQPLFFRGEILMKNKTNKVARKITALLAGVMISGQLATPGAAILAHAESGTVDYSLEQDVSAGLIGPGGAFVAEGGAGESGGSTTAVTSGTIITGYEMVITSDNKYYARVTSAVDKLVKAPQVSNGKKYTTWTTVCPYTNSSTKTDLTVSINMSLRDVGNYRSEEELLKNAVFHISGTHRGKKVDRYISYCSQLKNLREYLQKAKYAQLQIYCRTSKTLHGHYMYALDSTHVLIWTDEMGRIAVAANSEVGQMYNWATVKITNVKPLNPNAPGTNNYDISGKVIFVK